LNCLFTLSLNSGLITRL